MQQCNPGQHEEAAMLAAIRSVNALTPERHASVDAALSVR